MGIKPKLQKAERFVLSNTGGSGVITYDELGVSFEL